VKPRLEFGVGVPWPHEVQQLLTYIEHIHDPRLRAMLSVFLTAGLRASELRGLEWTHLDLDAGVACIVQRADRFNEIGNTKSKAGNREVPLPPFAVDALKAYRPHCPRKGGTLLGTTPDKAQQVARYPMAYPDLPHRHLARILKVDRDVIKEIRGMLGLPPQQVDIDPEIPELPADTPVPDLLYDEICKGPPGYSIARVKAVEVARLLSVFPDLKNGHLAEYFGCSSLGVARVRDALGLPPSVKGRFKKFVVPPPPPDNLTVILPEQKEGELKYVFPNKHGELWAHEVYVAHLQRALVAAGITKPGDPTKPKYTGHKLRHFFGSMMANSGFPMRRLQGLLGHSRLSSTEVYSHFTPDIENDREQVTAVMAKIVPLSYLQRK
jgi:integrase